MLMIGKWMWRAVQPVFDVSLVLNARVMANVAEELPLTFRITLEESIFAV